MGRAVVMLLWIGVVLCAFGQAFGQQTAGMIRSVGYTAEEGVERIDISLDGPHQPEIFLIDSEKPRIVLDFPEYGYAGRSAIPVVGGVLVQSIRVGIHTSPERKIRLVVDLKPGRGISWHQDYHADDGVLTLAIAPAAEDHGSTPAVTEEPNPFAGTAPPPEHAAAPAQTRQPEPDVEPVRITAGLRKVKVTPKPMVEQPQKTQDDSKAPAPSVAGEPSESKEQTPVTKEQSPVAKEQNPAEVPEAPADTAPVLLSVSFDNAFSHSGEMVLLQLSDFRPPEITTREAEPPGIFCYFAGAVVDEGVQEEIAANGRYVDKVRVVGEEGGVRVILDLVPGSDYDLQQVYFKEDNLFVLIVNLLEE